jgi:hypothetical protein
MKPTFNNLQIIYILKLTLIFVKLWLGTNEKAVFFITGAFVLYQIEFYCRLLGTS